MVKSSYERAMDKQMKEAKKQAEEAARRERANAIVSGQPSVNGFRIMDQTSEEMLKIILECYDSNTNNLVKGNYDVFPEYIQNSIGLEFEKLRMYGIVTSSQIYLGGEWYVYLAPYAKTYFANKDRALLIDQSKSLIYTSARKQYDVFISHANKDKLSYVGDLYMTLRRLGINIFYDSDVLSWGDNWKQVILEGTAQSEFAIIVISDQFFGREWTERELNELLQRQNESGQKVILPLLYNITYDELKEHYPELEFIQSIKANDHSHEDIAVLLAKELIKRYR